ncbi:hypothetical protein [Bradyrhizobium cenepequi]|uniref:hypothetical protein n=1 Tax=Bradyrhizobium cenepequi TaxID=2821403 RepID=UPI001CE2408B|nr:hypothetical protein [Bradyrhizobium cenepequi]MCA6107303.1 hypothetical protein [Bradyrhizobium cenepequi]
MLSTLNAKESDPHDVFVIDPEVVLAARGDRAPPTPRAEVDHAPAPQSYAASSASAPSLDTSFRVTASDHIQLPTEPSPIAKWAKRAAMAFLFALLSAFAAAAWKHHGDTAKQMIAEWIPQFSLLSSLSSQSSGDATATEEQPAPPAVQTAADEPAAPAVQTAATDQAPAQPDTAPQSQAAEAAAPTAAAPLSPDSSQLLQSMAHDLATMGQQIQQLKATIEQLKAGQDQIARDMARASEARVSAQAARPRTAPPARPVAAPVRRPKPPPAYPPAQTAIAAPPPPPPPPPVQTVPQPQAQDGGPVVRPPMPVR